jgi:hypothetical protein
MGIRVGPEQVRNGYTNGAVAGASTLAPHDSGEHVRESLTKGDAPGLLARFWLMVQKGDTALSRIPIAIVSSLIIIAANAGMMYAITKSNNDEILLLRTYREDQEKRLIRLEVGNEYAKQAEATNRKLDQLIDLLQKQTNKR